MIGDAVGFVAMSVWAGATLYLRVVDGHRELYVPQGLSLEKHAHSCWKVKRDPLSNRTFFVNVAGLGKKWRLPDIYDPKNTLFLHGRDTAQSGAITPVLLDRRSSKAVSAVDSTPAAGMENSEPMAIGLPLVSVRKEP